MPRRPSSTQSNFREIALWLQAQIRWTQQQPPSPRNEEWLAWAIPRLQAVQKLNTLLEDIA